MNDENSKALPVSELAALGRNRLKTAGLESPGGDARRLLAEALACDLSGLILRGEAVASREEQARFLAWIARREAGEPVSKIVGRRAFMGLDFEVTLDVLDPRPETECLVELTRAQLPPDGRLLEIGAGSGCVVVSLMAARPDCSAVATDVSAAALAVARRNALRHGVADRISFIETDWAAGVSGPFDVVVSNPPYIRTADLAGLSREVVDHDPRLALDGGADGLAAYRAIIPEAHALLKPGGWLALETGYDQSGEVSALLTAAGWRDVAPYEDLSGTQRGVLARKACE